MRQVNTACAKGIAAGLACLVGVVCGGGASGQVDPSKNPGQFGDVPPSTPLPPAPGSDPNEYPGPRGTKIRFPTSLYDEKAVGLDQIKQVRKEAAKDNKRVLVMWGENHCGFCIFLDDLMKNDPAIAPLVKNEYVWIKVNIGKFDRHIDLAQFYETPIMDQGFGAPALTVIDPVKDRAVAVKGGNSLVARPMTETHVFDEQVISEFLTKSIAPPKVAQIVLNETLDRAAKSKKPVLAYFIVPQCEECAAIEKWLSRPEVAPVISRGFEVVKLDTERMTGGRTILNRLAEGKIVASPQLALVNVEGDLFEPGARFAGLPSETEEIARFVAVLRKAAPAIDQAGADALTASLTNPGKAQAEK